MHTILFYKTFQTMNLLQSFNRLKDKKLEYLEQYCFNHPIVFTEETYLNMKALGQILYKAIKHYLDNTESYRYLFPRSERDTHIIKLCNRYPGTPGTFRADFIIDSTGCIKLIELTTRQPFNGYFTSGIFREIALKQAVQYKIRSIIDVYPGFFNYLESVIGNAKRIVVIKGNNKLEEFHFYPQLFEGAGIECIIIPIEHLNEKIALLKNSWTIEELTFDEIRQLPDHLIEALAEHQIHNNVKTLFTTHDKTFFHVLCHPDFQNNVFSSDEKELLNKHLVPTYIYGRNQEIWEDANRNREHYILKHREKGKSVDIFAGKVCDDATWQKLFDESTIQNMILQPYIEQRKIHGYVGKEERKDFAVGTLLYFNDHFFGPGLYRTSSYPISNITDNRKAAMLISKSTQDIDPEYCL